MRIWFLVALVGCGEVTGDPIDAPKQIDSPVARAPLEPLPYRMRRALEQQEQLRPLRARHSFAC